MNVRPLVLAALALGFAAGCSKPPASSVPPASEPGTAAAPSEAQPPQAAPPANEPGTANAMPNNDPAPNAPAARPAEAGVYLVRNSGVRCITTPCPYFLATPADKPDTDAIQVHELDLAAISGGSEERMQELLRKTEDGAGLKVEGSFDTQQNAGPAGAATIFRAKRVVGG